MADATFSQRKAIFNMRTALGISLQGIKYLSFDQAGKEIENLKNIIAANGFSKKDEDYLNGRDGNFKPEK